MRDGTSAKNRPSRFKLPYTTYPYVHITTPRSAARPIRVIIRHNNNQSSTRVLEAARGVPHTKSHGEDSNLREAHRLARLGHANADRVLAGECAAHAVDSGLCEAHALRAEVHGHRLPSRDVHSLKAWLNCVRVAR